MADQELIDSSAFNNESSVYQDDLYESYGSEYDGGNETVSYVPYNQRPETYIVPVLLAIIFVVGVVGNVTLVVIFARNKSLRNVPNTYIISLALGDLLVLFFTVPFVSTIYTLDSWPYGLVVCKFSEFVKDVSVGVTVFTLTALSADRYMAIVSPLPRSGGGATVGVAIGIWFVALFLATPAAVLTNVEEFQIAYNKSIVVCFPFPRWLPEWYPQSNVLTKILVYYVVPLVAIATFYLLMARHLILSSNTVLGKQGIHKQMQTRRKVAKIVFCFVLIFAICFLPTHVFIVWFYFNPNSGIEYNDFWHYFRIVGFCLSFINSCINPLALYSISGTFRIYYNQYLFCWCCSSESLPERSLMNRGDRMGGSRYHSTSARATCTMMVTPFIRQPSNATTATTVPLLCVHNTLGISRTVSGTRKSGLADRTDGHAVTCFEPATSRHRSFRKSGCHNTQFSHEGFPCVGFTTRDKQYTDEEGGLRAGSTRSLSGKYRYGGNTTHLATTNEHSFITGPSSYESSLTRTHKSHEKIKQFD